MILFCSLSLSLFLCLFFFPLSLSICPSKVWASGSFIDKRGDMLQSAVQREIAKIVAAKDQSDSGEDATPFWLEGPREEFKSHDSLNDISSSYWDLAEYQGQDY